MKLIRCEVLCREDEYYDYLNSHINGVRRSWLEILKPHAKNKLGPEYSAIIERTDNLVSTHDASKYEEEEFVPYRKEFYPLPDEIPEDNKVDYDRAWNHHQKCNPHHWQYWILQKDSGDQVLLDMPLEYVLEMLCDWHSFTLRDPESTAFKWYNDNKDKMVLSNGTIELIEEYIEHLRQPLVKVGE